MRDTLDCLLPRQWCLPNFRYGCIVSLFSFHTSQFYSLLRITVSSAQDILPTHYLQQTSRRTPSSEQLSEFRRQYIWRPSPGRTIPRRSSHRSSGTASSPECLSSWTVARVLV